jgi:hydrogenase maturation protease
MTEPSSGRILVAGIGNIFFGDDGFGCAVAERLLARSLPDGVTVVDYGIRGMHLAYDMLAGYDATILVDAVPRGDEPGTIYVIDVTSVGADTLRPSRQLDPHGMTPDAVLDLHRTLGGEPSRIYVVGCEPANTDEEIGLGPAVAASVDTAVTAVMDLVQELRVAPLKGAT